MSKSQRDTIIGIDPGPDGWAWAKLEDGAFVDWGEMLRSDYLGFHLIMVHWPRVARVAIETISRPALSKHELATSRMVGYLEGYCDINQIPYILVTRKEAAESCGKPGRLRKGQRYGDTQIIRYLHTVYPELRELRPLNRYNHIYAACAVAHCAVGKIQAERIR